MAFRSLLAALLVGACTTGPPFGDDLATIHHDPFPAASEREARFARIEQFGSPERCLAHLAELGDVLRLSSYEAVVHRAVPHHGRPATEEHHCAQETLRIRAWYTDGGGAAHH
jgi:hypothetical protein